MRTGDLSAGIARLESALEALQSARKHAAESWDDAKFRQLQEQYFFPLDAKVRRLLDAAARIEHVLGKACRECGPEGESG